MPEAAAGAAQAEVNLTFFGLLRTTRGRSLLLLSACVLLLWAVMMSVFPALPKIAAALQISPDRLGLILSGSSLLMTLLNIPAGVLSDRFGRRPPIVAGLAISAVAIVLVAVWAQAAVFVIGWGLLFGIGRGLFISPAFTAPADQFAPQERGKAIGIMAGGIGVGSGLGFVVSGLILTAASWRTVMVMDAVILVLVALLAAFALPETSTTRKNTPLGKAVVQTFGWYRRRVVLLSGIAAGLSFAAGVAATFLVPFSLAGLHASAFLIAVLFIPYEAVASLGTTIAGALGDRFGRKPPLLAALVLVTVALAVLPIVGVSIASFCVVYALIGLSEGPVISLSTTMVTDDVLKVDPRSIGAALGANRLVQGIGPIVGPGLGGLLAQQMSLSHRYLVIAAIVLLSAVLAVFLPETHRPAPKPSAELSPQPSPGPVSASDPVTAEPASAQSVDIRSEAAPQGTTQPGAGQ